MFQYLSLYKLSSAVFLLTLFVGCTSVETSARKVFENAGSMISSSRQTFWGSESENQREHTQEKQGAVFTDNPRASYGNPQEFRQEPQWHPEQDLRNSHDENHERRNLDSLWRERLEPIEPSNRPKTQYFQDHTPPTEQVLF